MKNVLARTLAVGVVFLALCSPASAQLFRAYVSSTGNDLNPCNLPNPCRLLPAALTAVADGGEIWMLDSANFNFNQVEITKSVTILAVPGAVGSVVANGGHAIHINNSGIKVTLRNLVVIHFAGSSDGINFAQGAALIVEGCEIANVTGNGINAQASSGRLAVKDTVIRDTGSSGVRAGNGMVVSLSGVQIKGAGAGGVTGEAPVRMTVVDSVLADNAQGVEAASSSAAGPLYVVVEKTLIKGSVPGVRAECLDPCVGVDVNLARNTISDNFPGVSAKTDNANLSLALDGNFVFFSGAAPITTVSGSPTINTLSNNTVIGSITATLTTFSAQ